MNNFARRVSANKGKLFAALAALPVLASATPTDPFTTALGSATTAVGTYAAGLVTLSAVAVVFMLAMKYVKKIPRAG